MEIIGESGKLEVDMNASILLSFTAFMIDLPADRPENFQEVCLLRWPQADILIPWPEGRTAKEAIIEWALAQTRS